MRAPLEALRRALPDLPPRLRAVGQYLTQHEFDAATRSMRGLAATAGFNPASFTRLAQALGYTGWDDLRDALIEARRPGPAAPFSARLTTLPPDPASIAAATLEADAANLARLDTTPIQAAAAALHAAPRIWIAGFRSCRAVAELLRYQLRLFRPDSVHLVGGAGPEDLDFGAFRSADALVVLGFAPYSRASLTAAKAAHQAGCTLIAIADSQAAPLAERAHHLILFDATGPGFFPSLTGAIAQAQSLAAATFAIGGAPALLRLQQTEARLAAHAQYVGDTP